VPLILFGFAKKRLKEKKNDVILKGKKSVQLKQQKILLFSYLFHAQFNAHF
jgi:hypothetical protein